MSTGFVRTMHLALFLIFGAVCIGGAINLLVQKHPITARCL